MITEQQLEDIHAQLELLLEAEDAKVDAVYHCPYLDGPEAIVPKYRRDSDLRKPKPGMLLKAAKELHLDLDHSWMVGDASEDVQAGLAAGCRTVLLSDANEPPPGVDPDYVAESLPEAADIVLNGADAQRQPTADLSTGAERTSTRGSFAIDGEALLKVLRDVRSLLQQQLRESIQKDFSLARLGATLFQIVAVAILLWGLAAYISSEPGGDIAALSRFALAGVIQLIALTLYITDRSN